MSLKVWLPLNGNLIQQGCSNVVATANGATVDSAGKIGSCYSFDGSDDLISLTGNDLYDIISGGTQPMSFAFWVYHADSTRAVIFGDFQLSGAISFNIELTTAHRVRFYWSGSPDKNFSTESAVSASDWTHIAITYDGNVLKIYKDGILSSDTYNGTLAVKTKTSGAYYLGRDNRTGTTVLNGRLNDFRIYDHCLSAAEVREISQGLILHYKLDSPYIETTTNLLSESLSYSEQTTLSVVSSSSTNAYVNSAVICSNAGNNIVTYSVYMINNMDTTIYPRLRGMGADGSTYGSYVSGNTLAAGQEGWVTVTLDMTDTTKYDGTSVYLRWQLGKARNTITGNPIRQYAQLEIGNHRSPWVLGGTTRNGVIQDSSGYNHNGITAENLAISTNTPRYLSSVQFNGTNSVIDGGRGALVTDTITVSYWAYMANWNQMTTAMRTVTSADTCGWYLDPYTAGKFVVWFQVGTSAGNKYQLTTNISYKQLSAGWHHFAYTYDGYSTAFYCDGILDRQYTHSTTKQPIYYTTGTSLYIGAKVGGTTGFFNGQISDLRIYATPLLEEDIKQLYQLGAKIDNKNNLHTFESIENGENKITKTGQIRSGIFTEFNGMSYLKYDNNIYIEPDGSCWVRVFHHNNPAAGRFTSSNDFEHSVYIDEDRWFNMELAYYLDKWEIMIKGKFTDTSNEWKLRWIQQYNPMTATYDNVAAANVLKIISDENDPGNYVLTPSSWGGLYKKNSNTYLCANNGTSTSWWGAVGAWNVHQSGLPGWGPSQTVTTTGYNDVYLRIDNVTFSDPTAKTTKNNIWTSSQFIEI